MQSPPDYQLVRKYQADASHPNDGMLVIKARCGSLFRRIPILNRELTFDELCIMLHRLFRDHLSPNINTMQLVYRDNEGDWISLTDDLDIAHAASLSSVLTVAVYDKETMPDGFTVGQTVNTNSQMAELLRQLNLSTTGSQRRTSIRDQLLGIKTAIDGLLKEFEEVSAELLQGVKSASQTSTKSPPSSPDQKSAANGAATSTTDSGAKHAIKPLSTSDMAELLDGPLHNKRRSEVGGTPVISGANSSPAGGLLSQTTGTTDSAQSTGQPITLGPPAMQQQHQPQQLQTQQTFQHPQYQYDQTTGAYHHRANPYMQQPQPYYQHQAQHYPHQRPQSYDGASGNIAHVPSHQPPPQPYYQSPAVGTPQPPAAVLQHQSSAGSLPPLPQSLTQSLAHPGSPQPAVHPNHSHHQ